MMLKTIFCPECFDCVNLAKISHSPQPFLKNVTPLNEGGRVWKDDAGAVKNMFDDSVFTLQKNLKLEGLISCLVDNLFWDESKSIEICVIDTLNKSFVTSQEELKYVGLNIEQGQRCIYLDQQMHTGKLKKLT